MDLLAGTEMPQVAVYTNARYVTAVNKDLATVAESNFISGFISEEPERSFQHVRARLSENDKTGARYHLPCIVIEQEDADKTSPLNLSEHVSRHLWCRPLHLGGDIRTGLSMLTALLQTVDGHRTKRERWRLHACLEFRRPTLPEFIQGRRLCTDARLPYRASGLTGWANSHRCW